MGTEDVTDNGWVVTGGRDDVVATGVVAGFDVIGVVVDVGGGVVDGRSGVVGGTVDVGRGVVVGRKVVVGATVVVAGADVVKAETALHGEEVLVPMALTFQK